MSIHPAAIIVASLILIFILGNFVAAWDRRRKAGQKLYRKRLAEALADGIITPDEMAELEALRAKHEISQAEARMAALAVYRRALRDAVADHELTDEEDASLQRLQMQLGLREADIRSDLTQVSRLRLLGRISRGELPEVEKPAVALVDGEVCHWVVRATLAERVAIPSPRQSELRAITFNVDDDAPFSARGERDALKPADEILPHDLGILVVTNRRVLFQGAKKNIAIPHARLNAVTLYRDGVRLDENAGSNGGKTTRRFYLVDDAELTAAVTLQAARLRRVDIQPATRPHRTA